MPARPAAPPLLPTFGAIPPVERHVTGDAHLVGYGWLEVSGQNTVALTDAEREIELALLLL